MKHLREEDDEHTVLAKELYCSQPNSFGIAMGIVLMVSCKAMASSRHPFCPQPFLPSLLPPQNNSHPQKLTLLVELIPFFVPVPPILGYVRQCLGRLVKVFGKLVICDDNYFLI